MDAYDFVDEEEPKRRFNLNFKYADLIWNIGTVYFLLMTVLAIFVFALIFINPWVGLNPYPPPLLPPTAPPLGGGEGVNSPEPPDSGTVQVTVTSTIAVTLTPTPLGPLPTPTFVGLTSPTPSLTPNGEFRFVVQPDTPVTMDASTFYPDEACNFMGVAGQVFDASGASIVSQAVKLMGTLAGETVDEINFTGINTPYGNGAYYEFVLADEPIASTASLEIQLLNQEGDPISEPLLFNTFDDCSQNLIIINFVEVG